MSVKIIFKEQDQDLYWKYWQDLINKKRASYRYLKTYIEQSVLMSKDKEFWHADKSFIYLVNNQPIACIFLPIENIKGSFAISIGGSYVAAPLFIDSKIEKKVFSIIDQIASDSKAGKIMFLLDPIDNSFNYNYLQKYNYLDSSILEYIIDLNISDDLLSACRKGHKCDIKKILNNKDFSVFYINENNPDYLIHEEYVELHHKCSGRITRPKKTFNLQFEELKQGKAVLFGLKYKSKSIAYSYFGFNNKKAMYTSGANDPDYDNSPLYHVLLFSAMQYFKKQGVRYIDTDQPSSPSIQFGYYSDNKQLNIALFKRGFSGDFKSCYRGIKYFFQSAFKNDIKIFVSNYKIKR